VTRPHVYRTAIIHAQIEVAKYAILAANHPKFIGQWKSAKIALVALNLVQEYDCEAMVLNRLSEMGDA